MRHGTARLLPVFLVVGLVCALAATARADIISNLENHYTFDDDASPANDSSPNARHGAMSGATWVNDNVWGGVVGIGTSAFVSAALPASSTSAAFTIALWANLNEPLAGNPGLFQVQQGGTVPGGGGADKVLGAWVAGPPMAESTTTEGTVWGRLVDTAGIKGFAATGPPKLTTGGWTHLAFVSDGTTWQRYQNGVAEGAPITYSGTLAPHDTLFIGRQGSESAIGRLDDFRVYSRALSAADLGELVAAGTPGPELNVDFGQASGGAPNGPYQPGFRTFEANDSNPGGPPITKAYGSALGGGGTVDVTIGGYTHLRDYSPITGAYAGLSNLLSDYALRNDGVGETMSLTLDNLLAGSYEITTYHHDARVTSGPSRHDIHLSDASVMDAVVFSDVPTTAGTSPSAVSTRTFRFAADGASPVQIDFVRSVASGHMGFNGFELTEAAPLTGPAELKVDFGQSVVAGPTQAGFEPFEAQHEVGGPDLVNTYLSPLGINDSVRVTVGGYTHFRDYPAVTAGPYVGLSDLLSDDMLRNAAGTATLSLDNLEPGFYEITLYHHDTQSGGGTRAHDVVLTDALSPGVTVYSGVRTTGGAAPTSISTTTFQFTAEQGAPVQIDLVADAGSGHTALSGFELVPTSPALRVDFGAASGGNPNGPVQDKFYTFEANEGSGNPDHARTFATPLGVAGTVDVTIGGYTHFRDYMAVSGGPYVGQSSLLSDMVLRNADGTMKLTLDALRPGTYDITTYHHNTQLGGGTIDIALTDAAVTGQTLFTDVPVTNGPAPASITTRTFPILADGSPVSVDFLGGAESQHNTFNGFELVPGMGPLRVDFGSAFGDGGGPGGTQPGFLTFEHDGTTSKTVSYVSGLAADSSVDVTISGTTHWRDYMAVSSGPYAGQSPLLSDMALRNADGTMTLTLADLKPGAYDIKTYHHNTQLGGGTIDIALTDGSRTAQTLFTGVPVTTGASPTAISTVEFQCVSDGSPVAIDFLGGAGLEHNTLNGFELAPSTGPLRVDFGSALGDGGGPGGTQAGFLAFEHDGTADKTLSFVSGLGTDTSVEVTVAGTTHWRDYAAVTGGPHVGDNRLLSDMALRFADGTMTLTLGDLKPGLYEITTYHHSTQFGGGSFDMALTDAHVAGEPVFTNVPVTAGQTPSSISTQTLRFTSDGSPVVIDFLGGDPAYHLPLNGFELVSAAPPEALAVDFGNSTGYQDGPAGLQAGFYGFEAAEGGGNPAITRTYYSAFGQDGTVDVTVGGYTHFRDYLPATGDFADLSFLLADNVLRNADGVMTLTLENLIEGWYDITTYHHTTRHDGTRTFDVLLDDAGPYDQLLFTGVGMSSNASAELSTLTFRFTVLDGSPVSIDFSTFGGSGHFALDGFELAYTVIPEPATMALFGLGALLALRRRRRQCG